LTGCVGPAKPVAFIEDAVFVSAHCPLRARFAINMKPLELTASYYGHAASGLLHVRPVLVCTAPPILKKFRQVADETSALVRQFKGSLSAEARRRHRAHRYMRDNLAISCWM